jgi:hypothetical protein
MKMRKKPAALMLFTALLSFGICESVYKYFSSAPSQAQPPAQTVQAAVMSTQQLVPVSEPAQSSKTRIAHFHKDSSSNSDTDEALLQTDPVPDLLRPETQAGSEVSSYTPSETPDTITRPIGPLDLGLVPSVVILPKKQEPLASSGLYDKKHQARGERQNSTASSEKIFL